MPNQTVDKAVAYITCDGKLLVFDHPGIPETGTQVPAGTIAPGEPPAEAAMREAFEETGLTSLVMRRFLGERAFDIAPFGRDEIYHRYFFIWSMRTTHLTAGDTSRNSRTTAASLWNSSYTRSICRLTRWS